MNRSLAAVAAVWLLFVASVYVPDAGRGFIKDDFAWIRGARGSVASIVRPRTPGFYRPAVAITFKIDDALHGLDARPYGLTNLLLAAACAAAIAVLIRRMGLGPHAALLGALAWTANPHGINMAIMWISGRTSLLLTLWSVAAAIAFLDRRRGAGALFVLLAALSKEEAVVLPAAIGAILVAHRPAERRANAADTASAAAAIAVYLCLRARTPAFLPSTAPWFYQPITDPLLLSSNALRYLDRGATIGVMVAAAIAAACGVKPRFEPGERRLFTAGAAWFLLGFALTVFVPVRSSLYAVFPSVGTALALAAFVEAIRRASPRFDRRAAAVSLALLLVVPIYRARNGRWRQPADVSARAMAAVSADAPTLPSHGTIVFEDDSAAPANFDSAFGTLATDAVQLYTSRPLQAFVVPARDASLAAPLHPDIVARYRLVDGRVLRVR